MKHEFKDIKYKLLEISSRAFQHNEFIPPQFTCDGRNFNPPFRIEHIPEEAKSLALIVDDPDAGGGLWVHWVVWNVPITNHIEENSIPGIEGVNDSKNNHYHGPCPPSGTHRYFFKIYALDSVLDLPATTTKQALEIAMQPHIKGFGEIIGLYQRK
jgi:Raf kinase inhibitor-like YbhB/YbcL family protein